jgi:TRAP-type C4-dicarboxylate transport system permease small subunit
MHGEIGFLGGNIIMDRFEGIVHWMSQKLSWVAFIGIVAMMALTTADITGRYVFGRPITGAFDASGLIGLVIVAAALADTQISRGHVSVDFLVLKLRGRLKTVTIFVGYLISLGVFLLIVWRGIAYGIYWQRIGEVTQTVRIPFWPFAFVIAIGAIQICLVLTVDILKSLGKASKKR